MLVLVGSNHRSAPVEVRERMSFPLERLGEAHRALIAIEGIAEGLILSTCNRVELYAGAVDQTAAEALAAFLARSAASRGSDLREPPGTLYRLTDGDAVRHAFRVAASLDSMVIGETQILGQVKEAYQLAEQAGTGDFFGSRLTFTSMAMTEAVWFHSDRSAPSAIQTSSRSVKGPGSTPTTPASS